MSKISIRPDESLELRMARIDETIVALRRNAIPYDKIEHLDKALTDESRFKEKNECVRDKLFELRLVLDSLVIRGSRRAIRGAKRNRDFSSTIPLEVRRLRYR